MAKLLSLFHHQGQKSPSRDLNFVVFECLTPEKIASLSPDVMSLGDTLFVANLSVVNTYWKKQGERQGLSHYEVISQVVQQDLTPQGLHLFCEHPFQGLVFFHHLKNNQAQGCFYSDSLFAQKVYKNMAWYPWMIAAQQVHDLFEEHGALNKERKNFATHLKRFLNFTQRVDMQIFSELEQAQFYEVQRRFHGFIGLLWRWTFPQAEGERDLQPSLFQFAHYQKLDHFPWLAFYESENIECVQHLEYPVSLWQQLEPFLIQDFSKLSHHRKLQPPYKVLQINWTLTTFDMSEVSQTIHFRYPISFASSIAQTDSNSVSLCENTCHPEHGVCHPEHSEGSSKQRQILRCAQDDNYFTRDDNCLTRDDSRFAQESRFSLKKTGHHPFSALLKQFELAFTQLQSNFKNQEEDFENINTPLLLGWRIEVTKTLQLREKNQWLDGKQQKAQDHQDELINLSNKLGGPIRHFQVRQNFIPGLDFDEKDLKEDLFCETDHPLLDLPRPFYIFPQEKPLEASMIKKTQFLDRTASDWWTRKDEKDCYRDCFLCELKDNSFVFAWRNPMGRWFQYGL